MTQDTSQIDHVPCPACGSLNGPDDNFCAQCGNEVRLAPAVDAGATIAFDPGKVFGWAEGPQRVAFKTDIGLHHRVNQDAGGAWNWTRADGTLVCLVVVADGVSAGSKSEGASSLTVELIHEQLAPLLQDPTTTAQDAVDALMKTAKEANSQVALRPHHSLSSADATTLVAAFSIGVEGGGIWCGDSRVYRVARHEIARLTRDHSWAEEVVSHGIMSAEEAARDPRAHMITRWLGPPDQDDPGLESFRFTLAADEVVLCCTDGLYMYFSPPYSTEEEMASLLRAADHELQQWVDTMVDIAIKRGGRDNITAGALRLSGTDGTQLEGRLDSATDVTVSQTVQIPRRGFDK